jgi:two-component system sensor histidine kinase UhpB
VSDNGVGFTREAGPKAGSFGHLGLRERAYLLGGSITIESEPTLGTRVELRIPEPKAVKS